MVCHVFWFSRLAADPAQIATASQASQDAPEVVDESDGRIIALKDSAKPVEPLKIPWRGIPFSYAAQNAPLADVLQALGAAEGISVSISPAVKGLVNGTFEKVSPEQFLQTMASTYGLTWSCEDSVLYIFSAGEIRSEFIRLDQLTPERAMDLLQQMNILDGRQTIRVVDNPPMLHVTGTPRTVESIRAIVTMAEDRLRKQIVRQEEARVFRLKHAWAADLRMPLRDQEITLPGVVSTLQRLMIQNSGTRDVPTHVVAGNSNAGNHSAVHALAALPSLTRPTATIAPNQVATAMPNPAATDQIATDSGGMAVAQPNTGFGNMVMPEQGDNGALNLSPEQVQLQMDNTIEPSIEADERLNAVLVRDASTRMPLYEELIKELDVPTDLIEIKASIIDINASLASSYGIRSYIASNSAHFKGQGGFDTINNDHTIDNSDIVQETGNLLASGVVINDQWQLMLLIKALENKGDARILSRPSLITFANREAELRDDQTYNVRVTSKEDAQLYSVTAGVQLLVTASIIDDVPTTTTQGSKIQLMIHLEDGSFDSSAQVDNLPQVRTSALNTQAIVNQGQSLLLGGYLRQVHSNIQERVPVLGGIPWIGAIFRGKDKSTQTMQRMFVLTPRIVRMDHSLDSQLRMDQKTKAMEERVAKYLSREANHDLTEGLKEATPPAAPNMPCPPQGK